jgi:hypothetical protein
MRWLEVSEERETNEVWTCRRRQGIDKRIFEIQGKGLKVEGDANSKALPTAIWGTTGWQNSRLGTPRKRPMFYEKKGVVIGFRSYIAPTLTKTLGSETTSSTDTVQVGVSVRGCVLSISVESRPLPCRSITKQIRRLT